MSRMRVVEEWRHFVGVSRSKQSWLRIFVMRTVF